MLHKGEVEYRKLVPDGIHPNAAGAAQVITPCILKGIGVNTVQDFHIRVRHQNSALSKIVVAKRGSTPDEDDVLFEFGTFMVCIAPNQRISTCFFLKTWKGPVRGIKMGDTREDVVKVLGPASIIFKDKHVSDKSTRIQRVKAKDSPVRVDSPS